ncbi:MAG: oligosaccharide flippase family protein [Patescibacteria group bacterium]
MKKIITHINNKFLKIDLQFLIKNSFYNISAYIISIACTLAVTYIIANNINEHETGVYRYIFSWYGVLGSLMLSGITSALTISIAKGFNSLKRAFIYKGWFSLIGVFTSLGIGAYYFANGNSELFWGFTILAVSMPILELSGLYTSFLQGREDFKSSSKFLIVNKVASLVCIVFFVFALKLTNSYILLFSNITIIGIIQLLYIYSLHKKLEDTSTQPTIDKELLKNSIHYSLMGIVFALGTQADKLILFQFFGSAALASYWIATTIPTEAQRFISQISNIYLPRFVHTDIGNRAFKKKFTYILLASTFAMTILTAVYYFSAPLIFSYLFPKYMEAISLSRLFFAVVILTPVSIVWYIFLAQEHLGKNYLYHIGDPVIQILLYILFVYTFKLGILGIVIAVLAKNFIVGAIGVYLLLTHKEKLKAV